MAKDKKIIKSKGKVTKEKAPKTEAGETTKAEVVPEQSKADNEQVAPVQGTESEDSLAKDVEAGEKSEKDVKKEAKSEAKPSAAGNEATPQKKISGLIFMCNSATKQDCFKYRVFGLPQARKELVEKISPGMKLFLFDSESKLLYGVYLATSRGGLNLEPQAFVKVDKRGFPAQVRFRIQRECLPLTEDVFKPAIKENYIDRNKFKFELNAEQVKKLTQLFRSAPRDAGKVDQQRPPQRYEKPERLGYEANAIRGDGRARRELPPQYNEVGYRGIPDYLPVKPRVDPISEMELRRLEYAREVPLVPADPYQDLNPLSYYRQLPRSSSIPDIGQSALNPDLELEALYRHRLQMYSDPRLERALGVDPLLSAPVLPAGLPGDPVRKRTLDEAFVDDRALLVPKRPHVQDDLLYRELEYQRAAAAAAADQRLVTKYYAGGLR
eukprot:c26797_g1_i2 orf=131-1447(+)